MIGCLVQAAMGSKLTPEIVQQKLARAQQRVKEAQAVVEVRAPCMCELDAHCYCLTCLLQAKHQLKQMKQDLLDPVHKQQLLGFHLSQGLIAMEAEKALVKKLEATQKWVTAAIEVVQAKEALQELSADVRDPTQKQKVLQSLMRSGGTTQGEAALKMEHTLQAARDRVKHAELWAEVLKQGCTSCTSECLHHTAGQG